MPNTPTLVQGNLSFDVMESRHLCNDAIDWLEAHPEQHIGGDFIRDRATGTRTYRVPEPSREDDYCYCFLGRIAQEARNRHPEQMRGDRGEHARVLGSGRAGR